MVVHSLGRQIDIIGVACSVLHPEIELLQAKGEIAFPVEYLDSRLHMKPELLEKALRERCDDILRSGVGVVLLYGDCHARMHHLCVNPQIARLDGLNCGDILLGRQRYKELMKQGAFLVFPEWAQRWRVILNELVNICGSCGLDIVHDTHDKLVYLDTGAVPVPEMELDECASTLGFSWVNMPVSLKHFHSLIQDAVTRLQTMPGETEIEEA